MTKMACTWVFWPGCTAAESCSSRAYTILALLQMPCECTVLLDVEFEEK